MLKKLTGEFADFAIKGNMLDLAIGVIIATAFGKIVSSLVNDLIMPAISMVFHGIDFTQMKFPANAPEGAATIAYGNFVQTAVDFFLITLSLFFFIKLLSRVRKKKEEAPPAPAQAEPSQTERLLSEIRDLLKEGK